MDSTNVVINFFCVPELLFFIVLWMKRGLEKLTEIRGEWWFVIPGEKRPRLFVSTACWIQRRLGCMDEDENKKQLKLIANGIVLTFERMEHLVYNLEFVRGSGYGKVTISVKKGKVYNLAFTVECELKSVYRKTD